MDIRAIVRPGTFTTPSSQLVSHAPTNAILAVIMPPVSAVATIQTSGFLVVRPVFPGRATMKQT